MTVHQANDPVSQYNIGLGRLLRFLQLVTSLRLQDVAIRKQTREEKKAERDQKMLERDQRDAKFLADEEEYLNNLDPGVPPDPEQFRITWTEQNPDIEIPPEVEHEQDLDVVEETN